MKIRFVCSQETEEVLDVELHKLLITFIKQVVASGMEHKTKKNWAE